ncbi:MAG: stage II sporulation protein M, partial [Solirubrobacteraceae bacterium]
HGGRFAIAFVATATAFSLSAQAYLLGHALGGLAAFLRVSPGVLLLGVLPHAIPELVALFLPLAAWIIASRRGEWEQLLAATVVTVAIALPILIVAAFIEVYVSPHLFTTLTHIHPPIVRVDGGWIVTVH